MTKTEDFMNDVKIVLDLDGTSMYDNKLKFYIPASLNKLKNEGLPNVVKKGDNNYYDFTLCLALEVAKYIDLDADITRIHQIVMERKIVLREELKNVTA